MRSSRMWRGAFSDATSSSLPSAPSPPRTPLFPPRSLSRARPAWGRRRSCAPPWPALQPPAFAYFSPARPAGEAELPYVGLGDLLGAFDAEAFASLAGPQRRAIEAALARGRADTPVERHALSRGLLEFLRSEGAAGDLLIVIDDVQWLDRPTVSVLSFALRRLGPVPVRVLAALRTDGSDAVQPFTFPDWSVRRLTVGPLSATELGALIRERLGEQMSRPRLKSLREASGGSPMFALELMRQGGENGDSRLSTLPLALSERLRELDPRARSAATVAAAALRPSPDMLLAAGVERAELESAIAVGILELDGERLSFPHPLLATAALELALPDERRRIHARLAAVSVDAVERGHHVAHSTVDRDEPAAELLGRAADEAAALGDHASAAAFLLRAAELSADPSGEAAQMREVAAGRELLHAGDVEATAALCQRLVEELPAGVARARARQTLTWCLVGSERSYEEGINDLELALRDCEGDDLAQADVHLDMAEMSLGMCRLERGVAHAQKAAELAEGAGPTMTAVQALAYVGFAESMLGLGVTAAARQAFERWDMTVTAATSPRMLLACVCLPTARFDEAEELFGQEIAWAREHGLEAVEAVARAHLAETQLRAGRWQDGLANARVAHEHARQAADPQIVTGIAYALAMLEASVGRHDDARALAGAALADAEATGDFWFTISHRAVLGQIALTENDAAAAARALEPAWELMLERGLGDLSLFPIAQTLGEAYVDDGRLDDATVVAAALRASPVGEQPWCRAMASRIDALVASARGEHAAAQAAFAAALEAHSDLPEPFEHARTLQLVGRAERRARNWGAARTALTDALERFEELGAATLGREHPRRDRQTSRPAAPRRGRIDDEGARGGGARRDRACQQGSRRSPACQPSHRGGDPLQGVREARRALTYRARRADCTRRRLNLCGFPQLKAPTLVPSLL